MGELEKFILDSHQIFFGLLTLAFCFSIILDVRKLNAGVSRERRIFYTTFIVIIGAGLSSAFLDVWQGAGSWFSIQFGLLCAISLVSPKYAASFFLFLLLTRPWETYSNDLMQTMPKDIFYLCCISLIGHKLAKKEIYFRFNLGTVLLIGFSIWAFLSGFLSSHFAEAMVKYQEVFVKGVILFLFLQNSFESKEDLLPAKLALALAILDLGTISFYSTYLEQFQTITSEGSQRLKTVGILGNSNDIAAILVLALPFCWFLFGKLKPKSITYLVSALICSPIFWLIWSTQSRGALLALAACIGAFFFTKLKTKKSMFLVGCLVLSVAIGSFSLLNRGQADLEGSSNNRIIYWKAGLNMAVRNPLFGVGFWGYNTNLPSYAVGGKLGSEGGHMTTHSSWIQVLSENGFIGFALYFGLWVFALKRSWHDRKDSPEYFVGLVGYGVASSFLSHAYQLYPYILTGICITHSYMERGKTIEEIEVKTIGELAWSK